MTSEVTRRTASRPRSAGNHLADTLLQASNALASRTASAMAAAAAAAPQHGAARTTKHPATSSSSSSVISKVNSSSSSRRPQTAPASRVRFSATAVITAAAATAARGSVAATPTSGDLPLTVDASLTRPLTADHRKLSRQLTSTLTVVDNTTVVAASAGVVIGRVSANGRALLTSHSEGLLPAANSVQGKTQQNTTQYSTAATVGCILLSCPVFCTTVLR